MKKIIYAVKFKGTKEVKRINLGNAILDESNRISSRKYDELHRASRKVLKARNGEYIKIMTEDNLITDFSGYPAIDVRSYIKFVEA